MGVAPLVPEFLVDDAVGQEIEEGVGLGIDIVPTLCDMTGIAPPPLTTAMSLRPLLEQQSPAWRDYLVVETQEIGRTARSAGSDRS